MSTLFKGIILFPWMQPPFLVIFTDTRKNTLNHEKECMFGYPDR